MSAAPTRPVDGFDPAERITQQSRALQALAEAGVELTRALVAEVASGREGPFRGVDPALAYSRISRAIRLAIALEHRLWEEPAQAAVAVRADEAEDSAEAIETDSAEGCEGPESERPEAERPESERPESERLREDLSDAALLARPSAEVYARICRDLGHVPEPGLFEPCNDDHDEAGAPEALPGPARRLAVGEGRAALLNSAAARPMAGPEPALGPFPRPP